MDLSGKRVLVTGGTGFIGSRLVERLILECNAAVRVLIHNFVHAARIARFPIEWVQGDLTDRSEVERAVDGCEVIVHCGYGNRGSGEARRQVTVHGTENVLEVAARARVKRVIHLSTVAVYKPKLHGLLVETDPRTLVECTIVASWRLKESLCITQNNAAYR
jgi:nucleoside-diphosphate-sugar epimerase